MIFCKRKCEGTICDCIQRVFKSDSINYRLGDRMRSIFKISRIRCFVIVCHYSVKRRKIVVSLSILGFYRQITRSRRENKYGPFTLLTPTAQLHELCTYSRASCLQFRFRSTKSFQREHSKIQKSPTLLKIGTSVSKKLYEPNLYCAFAEHSEI